VRPIPGDSRPHCDHAGRGAVDSVREAAENAFSEVKRFAWPDLDKAFEYLIVTKQRVALVLFIDSAFVNSRQGGKILMRRELNVHVICSDRVLGNVDQATFGVETVHPGRLS